MLLRHLRSPGFRHHPRRGIVQLARSLSSDSDWHPTKTRHINDFDTHDQLLQNEANVVHRRATAATSGRASNAGQPSEQPPTAVRYGRRRPRMNQAQNPAPLASHPQTPGESQFGLRVDRLSQQEIMEVEKLSCDQDGHERIMDEIRHGQPLVRQLIIAQLLTQGSAIEMMKHELGSKVIRALLRYGVPVQQASICSAMSGHVSELACHPQGRKCIEMALNVALQNDAGSNLVQELLANEQGIATMAVHPVATNIIRLLFEKATPYERSVIARAMQGRMLELSNNKYGTFVVQLAIQLLPEHDQEALVSELVASDRTVLACATNDYGVFALKLLIESSSVDTRLQIFSGLTSNAVAVATSKLGNVVLKAALRSMHKHGHDFERKLLIDSVLTSNIIDNVACDTSGTFLLEELLKTGSPPERATALKALQGRVARLALNQSGGFVLEAALRVADAPGREALVAELLTSDNAVRELAFHPCGNFVLKKALEVGSLDQQVAICDALGGLWLDLVTQSSGRVVMAALKCPGGRSAGIREQILSELLGDSRNIAKLAKSTTGRILLIDVLRKGSSMARQAIFAGMKGHVADIAADTNGNHVMQAAFQGSSPRTIDAIVAELLSDRGQSLVRCAMDQHGSFVINSLVRHGSPEVHRAICRGMRGNVIKLSKSEHARFLMQSVLKQTENNGLVRDELVAELFTSPEHILDCVLNEYASKVIVAALSGPSFDSEDRKVQERGNAIVSALQGRVVELASKPHAHNVVCHVLKNSGVGQRRELVQEILALPEDLIHLAKNELGVGVVRHLMARATPEEHLAMSRALQGRVLDLATHEFGHLVLRKAFSSMPDCAARVLVDELLASPESVMRCVKSVHGKSLVEQLRHEGSPEAQQQVETALQTIRSMQGVM